MPDIFSTPISEPREVFKGFLNLVFFYVVAFSYTSKCNIETQVASDLVNFCGRLNQKIVPFPLLTFGSICKKYFSSKNNFSSCMPIYPYCKNYSIKFIGKCYRKESFAMICRFCDQVSVNKVLCVIIRSLA